MIAADMENVVLLMLLAFVIVVMVVRTALWVSVQISATGMGHACQSLSYTANASLDMLAWTVTLKFVLTTVLDMDTALRMATVHVFLVTLVMIVPLVYVMMIVMIVVFA